MPLLYYLAVSALLGLAVNDWHLVGRVQRAIELGRLRLPGFQPSLMRGTPIGIVVHLFRLRALTGPGASDDPDAASIRRQYRAQVSLAVLLGLCLGLPSLRSLAIR